MNEELIETPVEAPASRYGFKMDAFIPLVLLSISFIVLLAWQVSITSTQRGQLETAISRQGPQVAQAEQVQAGLKKLAGDLMQAAQTDGTAKAIAAKYIKSNAPASPTASGL